MLLSLNKDKNGVVDQLEPIITDIDTIDSDNIDQLETLVNKLIVDPSWSSDYKQPLFDILSKILGIKVDSGSDIENVLHMLKTKFDTIVNTNKENKASIEVFDDQTSEDGSYRSNDVDEDLFGVTDEIDHVEDTEKEW